MARIWVTPEGKFYSTTRDDTHKEIAEWLVRSRDLKLTKNQDESEALLAHGFLRISDANVEGQLSAFRKRGDQLNKFLQSELHKRGKSHVAYFDFWDESGNKKVGWGHEPLGEVAFWNPDDWKRVYHQAIRKAPRYFGRRPGNSVRVRQYRRR